MSRTAPSLFVVLLTLAGCVTFEEDETGADTEGPTATAATASTTTGATSPVPTTGGTGGAAGECNVWQQDCMPGAKCVPFDSMQTGVVDATRCVEVADPAGKSGDPCTAEGGVVGLDDCDLGLLCWQLDENGNGTCIPLCEGAPGEPKCGEGLLCDVSNGGLLPLCLTACDPLLKNCPNGQICIPSMGLFVCDGDVSGDAGMYGDPCEFINVCDPGLTCVPATNVPGCNAPGCCTPYCDLTMPACPGPGQECLPYYEAGAAPPGLENVGLCGVKQ